MRIDDENKVVVPDYVAEWYEKHKQMYILGAMLDRLEKSDDEKIAKWRWDCKGRHSNGLGNSQEVIAKMMMFGYTIEQPQKYYWRKKKEHMVWFEVAQDTYLAQDEDDGELTLGWLEGAGWKCKFTETEARDLLKYDFDKFEKVECE